MANILLVEDSSVERHIVEEALRTGGLACRMATNGVEGLCEVYRDPPDVLLMDLNLPDMSGMDVIQSLRDKPPTGRAPHVFILTAKASPPLVSRAAELGVEGFLLKDKGHTQRLVQRVQSCVNQCLQEPGTSINDMPPPSNEPLPELVGRDEARDRAGNVGDLKSMSTTASRVIALTDNPDCKMTEIAEAVSQDPNVAAKIIRLANSPLFSRGGEIDDLEGALVRIGLRHTRRSVLNIVIIQHFHYSDPIGTWNSYLFWEHSIAVALIASTIAREAGGDLEQAEEAFTMGLLHDLGRAVFASEARPEFEKVVDIVNTQGLSLKQAEATMLGLDHTDIVGMVLDKWQFAEELSELIELHHGPLDECRQSSRPLSALSLLLANRLANAMMLGSSGDNTVKETKELAAELDLSDEFCRNLIGTIPAQTKELKEGLIDRFESDLWPNRMEQLRSRLTRTFRPVFFSETPHTDRFGIFCRMMTGFLHCPDPDLAIIHGSGTRAQTYLFKQLYDMEKRLGRRKDPLPLILLTEEQELKIPRQLRRRRNTYLVKPPSTFESLIDLINHCP